MAIPHYLTDPLTPQWTTARIANLIRVFKILQRDRMHNLEVCKKLTARHRVRSCPVVTGTVSPSAAVIVTLAGRLCADLSPSVRLGEAAPSSFRVCVLLSKSRTIVRASALRLSVAMRENVRVKVGASLRLRLVIRLGRPTITTIAITVASLSLARRLLIFHVMRPTGRRIRRRSRRCPG